MRLTRRRHAVASLGSVLLAASFAVLVAQPANAAPPPWEPDPNALGSLSFYDAGGTLKTSGSLTDAPFATYVLASADAPSGHIKATLSGATPDHSKQTGQWTVKQLSASTTFPDSSAPGALGTSTHPLVKVTDTDPTLADLIAAQPNVDTTAGYVDMYQLRVKTSGPGIPPGSAYYETDILVDSNAGTWTQVYPVPVAATSTATTLDASPASTQEQGQDVTLTATEVADDATHPPGTVQFKDNGANVGGPVGVNGSGVATMTSASFAVGSHSFTAVFTPTDTGSYAASTSSAVPYAITATPTTTTLTYAPNDAVQDEPITFTATIAPSEAAGAVQFKVGGTNTGAPVPVSGGTAAKVLSFPNVGMHEVSAELVPSSAAYAGSTSDVVVYGVTAAPPKWLPYLYGAHRVGMTESCLASIRYTTGITYTWANNGVTIPGATASTYKPGETLYHHTLTCTATGTGDGGSSTATSAGSLLGAGPALVPTTKPYLYHGTNRTTATHGSYEYVSHGTWSPAATTYTYQWYLGTTAITGATGASILVKSTWVGHYLYCKVTAKRGTAWTPGVYQPAGVKVI